MQLFFQSFLSTTKAIKSFLKENKKLKITFAKNALSFAVVSKQEKEGIDKSLKDFFLFIRKNSSHLDMENLPMGERLALIETVSVFEDYLSSSLPIYSRVRVILEAEIFSLKLGSSIPRSYIEKNSDDIKFIKNNSLGKILFYHGVRLSFDSKKGVGIPFQTVNCIQQVVFYNDLRKYSLSDIDKFYYKGEYLFSLDINQKLVKSLKVKNRALVICDEFTPFITYSSGYLAPSFELFHKRKDYFIAVHDGKGSIYRFGMNEKQVVSPDRYVYGDISDFNRILFDVSKEQSSSLLENILESDISSKEEMVESLLKTLDVHKIFVHPLTSKYKILSYLYIPKLLVRALKGEMDLKSLLTPWKLKRIDFKKMENNRSAISKKNFS